jgi:hypothetical protein
MLNEGIRKVEGWIKADETFRHAVKRMKYLITVA